MRDGNRVRFVLPGLLAAVLLLAMSCAQAPGVIEVTVTWSEFMDPSDGDTCIEIHEDTVSGDLAASRTASEYLLTFTNPYHYSYSGAAPGVYVVIAYLDRNDNGFKDVGDVASSAGDPSVLVLSEEMSSTTINLDTYLEP
jgi:uncharacterized protein (DUF2141 family)